MNQIAHRIDFWAPASQEDKIKALVSLGGLPAREASNPQIDKASYYLALKDVTRYSLVQAVEAIHQGKLGHGFFPTPPELRIQCDKAMESPRWHRSQQLREDRYARERRENNALTQRSPEAIARQQKAYQAFMAGYEADKAKADEAEHEVIRARYGITAESIAHLPDLEMPSNFKKLRP